MLMVKAFFSVVIVLSTAALAQDEFPAEQPPETVLTEAEHVSAGPEQAVEQPEELELTEEQQASELSEESESEGWERVAEQEAQPKSEEPEPVAELAEEGEFEEYVVLEQPQEILPAKAASRLAKNTITVDIAPFVMHMGFSQAGELLEKLFHDDWSPNYSGFGIGTQYERRINEKFGLVGRFDYAQGKLNLTMDNPELISVSISRGEILYEDNDVYHVVTSSWTASLKDVYYSETMLFNTWTLEAQARYYPTNSFYVSGILGFGGMRVGYDLKANMNLNREVVYDVRDQNTGDILERGLRTDSLSHIISVKPWRNYIKLGPVFGLKSEFGGPRGGFVWETSFGYHIAIGLGNSYSRTLIDVLKREGVLDGDTEVGPIMEDIVDAMELLLASGPRIASSIGWRF